MGTSHSKDRNAKEKTLSMVARETYFKLLEYCPSQEWRVLMALARYGGLRCPSEAMRLRWSDIDWKNKSLRVGKYADTKFGCYRLVPLFPKIRTELKSLLKVEKKKSKFIINQFPDRKKVNLCTSFEKIVRTAGMDPIRQPFRSMRYSRASELMEKFDLFLVYYWLGVSSHTILSGEQFIRTVTKKEIVEASEWDG